MSTALSCCDDVALVFDCPCPEEYLPVCSACFDHEGGGDEDDVSLLGAEKAVDFREAEVVTDGGSKAHREREVWISLRV